MTPDELLARLAVLAETIDATTETLAGLHRERLACYRTGVDLGVTKSAMAAAARVVPEAVMKSLKRDDERTAAG